MKKENAKSFLSKKFSGAIGLTILIAMSVFLIGCTQSDSSNPIPDSSNNSTAINNLTNYTSQEVAIHNTANDCWVILNKNVYNVSENIANSTNQFDLELANYCGSEVQTRAPTDANYPRTQDFNGSMGPRPDFNDSTQMNYPQGDLNSRRGSRDGAPATNALDQYLIGRLV